MKVNIQNEICPECESNKVLKDESLESYTQRGFVIVPVKCVRCYRHWRISFPLVEEKKSKTKGRKYNYERN